MPDHVEDNPSEVDEVEEDDLAYFTMKRRVRPIMRSIPKPRSPTPPLASDSDSEPKANGKKQIKRRKENTKHFLPDWTRSKNGSRRSIPRGSAETRRSASKGLPEVIDISSSDDDVDGSGKTAARSKGKGKAREGQTDPYTKKRSRVVLTPPPKISEKEIAQINQAIDTFYAKPTSPPISTIEAEESNSHPRSDPSSSAVAEDTITITIRMVAHPDKAKYASEKAIKQFEKRREFVMARSQMLSTVIEALADSLHRQPEDLVIVHRGMKLFATRLVPAKLWIADGDELSVWEQIIEQKEKAREEDFHVADDTTARENPSSPLSTHNKTPKPLEQQKITLTLQGSDGECTRRFPKTMAAEVLCRYYAEKYMKRLEMVGKLKLSINGEIIQPSTIVQDMDVEDGDLIDVVQVDTEPTNQDHSPSTSYAPPVVYEIDD